MLYLSIIVEIATDACLHIERLSKRACTLSLTRRQTAVVAVGCGRPLFGRRSVLGVCIEAIVLLFLWHGLKWYDLSASTVKVIYHLECVTFVQI